MGRAKKSPPDFEMWQSSRVCNSSDGLSQALSGGLTSVSDRVDAVVAADGARRLSMPHVVHLVDRATGLASAFGPFGDPLAASMFADLFVSDLVDVVPAGFVVTVVPLEPPE